MAPLAQQKNRKSELVNVQITVDGGRCAVHRCFQETKMHCNSIYIENKWRFNENENCVNQSRVETNLFMMHVNVLCVCLIEADRFKNQPSIWADAIHYDIEPITLTSDQITKMFLSIFYVDQQLCSFSLFCLSAVHREHSLCQTHHRWIIFIRHPDGGRQNIPNVI